MTVEASLFAVLSPLFGGRVFPDVAPVKTPRPYCTYQQIGGQAINYTDNAVPDQQHGLFQINVWAATRAEAASLARQIEDALRTSSAFAARPESAPIAQHEPDLDLYGTLQDFGIWSAR